MTGWIDRLEKLNTLLRQAQAIAEGIIGPSVETAGSEAKQPCCTAGRLTDELTTALDNAGFLVDQMTEINEKF
jgi:hypothetical protein